MGFRNSSQNRKAVKSERDSRSHTKLNIKGPHTQISRHFFFLIPHQIKHKKFHH